jgi:MYXO-CTERM domain-containing protein
VLAEVETQLTSDDSDGGCATTGDPGGVGWIWLALAGLAFARRRRAKSCRL